VLDTGPQAPRTVSSARTSQAPVGEGVASVAERERLGERPAVYRAVWSSGGHPAGSGVGGEVVWDPGSNRGHLRFLGLPRNEPRLEQYQLWIFDATRDERFPVDGGVFDATAPEGELIVPIDPRLPVGRASAFVVTLEPPGGVVVSDRSRIVAIARL
jgi:anti-sigma-K factor RskA